MKTDLITTLDLIDYAVFTGKPHNTACELIESNPALMTHVWELGRASFNLEDFDSPRFTEEVIILCTGFMIKNNLKSFTLISDK